MGGLGVVLDGPGRQSGLREELEETLEGCPALRDVGKLYREAQGAHRRLSVLDIRVYE